VFLAHDLKKEKEGPGVVVPACNPSTWVSEAGGI
jgi:hypothetical protein